MFGTTPIILNSRLGSQSAKGSSPVSRISVAIPTADDMPREIDKQSKPNKARLYWVYWVYYYHSG